MQMWNITCSRLYEDAKNNTQRLLPAELKTMAEVIRELSEGLEEPENKEVPMYVLTNSRRTLGAACILYEGMLELGRKTVGEAYYLLPSSVHEWILVPESVVTDRGELLSMVRDINVTQVRSTEVLSDQIYFYSPDSGQISLVEE